MRKAISVFLAVLLLLSGCASVNAEMGADGPAAQPEKSYPFLEDGYWHYGIRLDGEVLPLAHDAVIPVEDNKDNEILYPVSDVLDYFGVQYYFDPERTGTEFSTIVNGVTASRDPEDGTYMWFSNQQDGYGNCLAPRVIDGVFYAPNYFFEHTIGAVLTKIARGKEESMEYVNIVTGAAYEWGPGARGEAVMRWKDKNYTITPPSVAEGAPAWEQPWPNPGEIFHATAYKDSKVTFRITLASLAFRQAALVKIYAQNNDLVSCLFFTEASTQTVTLKAGTYTVKYASGPEWYGMYNTFGPGGHYQVMIFDNNKKTINLANNHEYELTINTSEHDKDSKNVGAEEVDPSDF